MKNGELSLWVHQPAALVMTTSEPTAMLSVETWSKENFLDLWRSIESILFFTNIVSLQIQISLLP